MLVTEIQQEIARRTIDGWLLVDFRGNNPIFTEIAALPGGTTRRCALWIPSLGTPLLFGSTVDAYVLSQSAWQVILYHSFSEFQEALRRTLRIAHTIALEFTPNGANPPISYVDGGFIDWLRTLGLTIQSSGDLISTLVRWDADQVHWHQEAARIVDQVRRASCQQTISDLLAAKPLQEHDVAQRIIAAFHSANLAHGATDVAANAHAADPHYASSPSNPNPLHLGDLLLIDLWAKQNHPRAPFADSTWVAFLGPRADIPRAIQERFDALRRARDQALDLLQHSLSISQPLRGRDLDRHARSILIEAGYGSELIHRTGHSLGCRHVHGEGTNLDDTEFPDDRLIQPHTGLTIEPGLYVPGKFGLRLEVSVVTTEHGLIVTTESQEMLDTIETISAY